MRELEMLFPFFIIIQLNFMSSFGSVGDNSRYYQDCLKNCIKEFCTKSGLEFISKYDQPLMNKLMKWSCGEECRYDCMWTTVKAFEDREYKIPQFYGKWPFIRFLGLQEPASVFFSLLNIYVQLRALKRFKNEVRKDSPMYWVWLFFCYVSINAWIWSAIFHARDVFFTEIMDYTCAFSMVYFFCYCMVIRLMRTSPQWLLITITVAFFMFFLNHATYLSTGKFQYHYNMQLNIFIGSTTALTWFLWSLYNRKRQPYVMKCALFVCLGVLSILLEVFDFPPLFYVLDPHSLWHLSSAPLTPLLYSFIIDDCRYLRKTEEQKKKIV